MRPDASDGELMELAATGDQQAYQVLAGRLRPRVKRFLRRLGCGLAEADDLAQETLIRLWVYRRSYHPERPLGPYLLGIAKNAYLAHCERTAREGAVAVTPADGELDRLLLRNGWQAEGPESAFFAHYREFRLAQAVSALPESERLVFVLKHHEGLPYDEIASLLGIAEGTVKSRMFRAVRALRRALPDLEPGGAQEES